MTKNSCQNKCMELITEVSKTKHKVGSHARDGINKHLKVTYINQIIIIIIIWTVIIVGTQVFQRQYGAIQQIKTKDGSFVSL